MKCLPFILLLTGCTGHTSYVNEHFWWCLGVCGSQGIEATQETHTQVTDNARSAVTSRRDSSESANDRAPNESEEKDEK